MRIIFAGTPEPAVAVLDALIESDHEVVAVLTRPDARRGRGRTLYPSAVAQRAEEAGIEVIKTTSLNAAAAVPEHAAEAAQAIERIKQLAPDCIPVVAYGALVPAALLDIAPFGWINLHFSLLPQWRGAAPVQAALAAGQTSTGATTFRIEEGLDTGPIAKTFTMDIAPDDTSATLLEKLALRGGQLMVETLDEFAAGSLELQPQVGEPSYVGKISVEDARLDWTQPCAHLSAISRAYTPAPGCWTLLGEQRYKLGPVAALPAEEAAALSLAPGEVSIEKRRVIVGAGDGCVVLSTIQAPGKKMIDAPAWGRGLASNKQAQAEGMVFQ